MSAGKYRAFSLHTLCILLSLTAARCQAMDKIHLLEFAEVHGKAVSLADLLPSSAPPELRKATATIGLCAAPQVGSSRVLRGEDISRRIADKAVLQQVAIPITVVVRNSGWPVGTENIRIAISGFLQQQGWDLKTFESSRLTFPPIASSEHNPKLEVTTAQPDERNGIVQLRLRCRERSACGSFMALLDHGNTPVIATRGVHVDLPDTSPGLLLAAKAKPATLVLQGRNMQLFVPVTCLDAGRLGQRIRVRDSRTGRVFTAEVTGIQLLKANL